MIFFAFVGYGAADFIDPAPSGSVIANFEGTINATTLICIVTRGETQIDTFWSIANFRGVADRQSLLSLGSSPNLFVVEGLFFDELTITNWTSEIDQVIVFCGTGGEPMQANVTLRIYRKFERRFNASYYFMLCYKITVGPPLLRDNLPLKILEGDLNIPIDLLEEPTAFPEPSDFEWFLDGQPLREEWYHHFLLEYNH